MTAPSLLDELEGVVRQLHEVDGKEGLVLEKMRMLSTGEVLATGRQYRKDKRSSERATPVNRPAIFSSRMV